MPKVLILADDLTGANDTGAAIAALGLDTYSVVSLSGASGDLNAYDCISVNLDSRVMGSSDAAQAVGHAALEYGAKEALLCAKRIDSTLRGNLGSECDALLDLLDPRTVVAMLPSFPSAGRTYENDTLFVHGIPLPETAAASDPRWPMDTASAVDVLRRQTQRPLCLFPLELVRQGKTALVEKATEVTEKGCKYLLFEAVTDEDIHLVAEAMAALGRPFIAADPGPFTAAAAKQLHLADPREVLAVVGSINGVSVLQTRELLRQRDVRCAQLEIEQLITSEAARNAEIRRCVDILKAPGKIRLLLLSSVLESPRTLFAEYTQRTELSATAIQQLVNDAISEAARQILEEVPSIRGLFSCGGDITVALCRALDAGGMQVREEVIPLAVSGTLTDRRGQHYLIVTKGGMVGTPQGMITCIDYLRNH